LASLRFAKSGRKAERIMNQIEFVATKVIADPEIGTV